MGISDTHAHTLYIFTKFISHSRAQTIQNPEHRKKKNNMITPKHQSLISVMILRNSQRTSIQFTEDMLTSSKRCRREVSWQNFVPGAVSKHTHTHKPKTVSLCFVTAQSKKVPHLLLT